VYPFEPVLQIFWCEVICFGLQCSLFRSPNYVYKVRS